MGSVAIFGDMAGLVVATLLTLQPNLEDLHRRDHGDCFCDTGRQTSCMMGFLSALDLRTGAGGPSGEIGFSLPLLTDKGPPVCQRAVMWIGEPGIGQHGLVALETQEPYSHFGYDAGEYGPEAFVKSKWRLSGDSRRRIYQALCLTLDKCSDKRSLSTRVLM